MISGTVLWVIFVIWVVVIVIAVDFVSRAAQVKKIGQVQEAIRKIGVGLGYGVRIYNDGEIIVTDSSSSWSVDGSQRSKRPVTDAQMREFVQEVKDYHKALESHLGVKIVKTVETNIPSHFEVQKTDPKKK